jgi:hypothetical protein
MGGRGEGGIGVVDNAGGGGGGPTERFINGKGGVIARSSTGSTGRTGRQCEDTMERWCNIAGERSGFSFIGGRGLHHVRQEKVLGRSVK